MSLYEEVKKNHSPITVEDYIRATGEKPRMADHNEIFGTKKLYGEKQFLTIFEFRTHPQLRGKHHEIVVTCFSRDGKSKLELALKKDTHYRDITFLITQFRSMVMAFI